MIFFRSAIVNFGIILLLCVASDAFSANHRPKRQTREEYVYRYKDIAVKHMHRYGIPASITMAQGILESDCGNSWLSTQSNNHFGIKCKRNWTGRKIYYDDDEKGECFRCYPSVEASYEDHAKFLDDQPRYEKLFSYPSNDYKNWARGLKAAGYATAPDYAERLIRIIEESHLYLLDQPDGGRLYASRYESDAQVEQWIADQSVAVSGEGVDPDNYRVTISSHAGYHVYQCNGVHYILAKENDTFESIGKKFRLSARNLRKFNDLTDKKAQPMTGETIYIQRKKKHWTGSQSTHVARKGETVFAVGQMYGIRSRSVLKLNKLPKNTLKLEEGTSIRLK